MHELGMKRKGFPMDVLFFVSTFLILAVFILAVNIVTNTWNGTSGHALATILAGLALVRYRWERLVPGRHVVLAFSIVAGFSAILFLYFLQVISALSRWFSFEPLRGYELLIAFVINALIFALTMWVKRRATIPE